MKMTKYRQDILLALIACMTDFLEIMLKILLRMALNKNWLKKSEVEMFEEMQLDSRQKTMKVIDMAGKGEDEEEDD